MFSKILRANDGSDPAFNALTLALDISKQSFAALHMVCVEEIPYLREYIEEVREETRVAGRRFHSVLQTGHRASSVVRSASPACRQSALCAMVQ
jgi:nucleotide-binding universal stress UspA family protein